MGPKIFSIRLTIWSSLILCLLILSRSRCLGLLSNSGSFMVTLRTVTKCGNWVASSKLRNGF